MDQQIRAQVLSPLPIEQDLDTMSPEEINQKLKELGITREEAEKRAAESGIDLQKYLLEHRGPDKPDSVQSKTPGMLKTEKVELPPDPPRTVAPQPHPLSPSGLPYFGYDVFLTVPHAFEPTAVGPADPEYLIGPSDVLKVAVWGQVEFQNNYTVDREGKIFVQTVGQILVSGLTLEQVRSRLEQHMSRSYAGLTSDPQTVWMDVSLASLRPKRIFIMGEVNAPGGYTVSSYATVFNSLYSIGGPTVGGSLREVRVTRSGKVIARVDLYDYLTGAEKTEDIRVQSNDIIFVPARGKTVSIRGGVRHEGTYEIREGENLADLLRFCGGLLPEAYASSVQIERIRPIDERNIKGEDRYILDVDLSAVIKREKHVDLMDGDLIRVGAVLDILRNYVVVRGSVWRPGRYELSGIQTVSDLIGTARGVRPNTYLQLAHLIRYNEDEVTTRIIQLDLQGVMENPETSIRLMPRDELIVYSRNIIEQKDKFVTIRGAVAEPGRYPFRNEMTLVDLVPLAGGYTEGAEVLEAEVSRFIPEGSSGDTLIIIIKPELPNAFSPHDAAPGSGSNPFRLQHRDEVLVRFNPNFMPQQNVIVSGDIMYPGVYAIQRRGERLSELIARAGGPTSTSYLGGGQFYRDGNRVLVDFLEAYNEQNSLHDILMMAGDSIVVPTRPHTVLMIGEVNKPGLLSFLDGDDVSDYIDRAGGLKDSALYVLLTKPTGETRKVELGIFSSDPSVSEGSIIEVTKEPPPPPPTQQADFFGTVKDIFALLASVAAVIFIVHTTAN